MTGRSKAVRATVFAVAAVVVVAGCSDSGGSSSSGPGKDRPAVAADVPQGFDPCKDIPATVMESLSLEPTSPKVFDGSGGIKWRGCGWVKPSGYTVGITATNLTLGMVRAKGFPDTRDFTIGLRSAVSTRRPDDSEACWVNVDMKGGTLEFLLNNPPYASTSKTDACELARGVAEKIAPSMPASA
ncbi:DUF3558 domain-containing protein [Nocardia panacis]|uniref:DUF3558 domain-containing protein n=1 Tax=Nocardia panacis TaxID=2340916 RepID=A0A3A4L2N6_9NOCA|nr:DUF3558 domain-containing protein [Nocardia panacis]RJO76633.1 DUF3558 domain-containing protein [Nocardia panacis]